MNTENKMYTCALCGKSYNSVLERSLCEQKCYAKQQEEAKMAAEAKKKAEQETRRAEVTKAIDNAYALMQAYIHDYNTYVYNGKSDLFKDVYTPTKFLHHLLF